MQSQEKICVLVGAGESGTFTQKHLQQCLQEKEKYFFVAVDGGIELFHRFNACPDFFLGDMDSQKGQLSDFLEAKNIQIFPREKDESDLHLALRYALNKGFKKFLILAALGRRLDHSFANLQLLTWLREKEAFALLLGEKESAFLLKDKERVRFSPKMKGIFSVFSVTEKVQNLQIKNAKYETKENFVLYRHFPMGLSNEFLSFPLKKVSQENACELSLDKGELLVIYEKQKKEAFPFVVFSKKIAYN